MSVRQLFHLLYEPQHVEELFNAPPYIQQLLLHAQLISKPTLDEREHFIKVYLVETLMQNQGFCLHL